MKAIKNLLFDLGGVLVGLDRMACVRAYEALGFADVGEYLTDFRQRDFFGEMEEGRITAQEFRAAVREHLAHPATDAEIDRALECFLTEIPRDRLDTLLELRSRYRIYLLSNTNPIVYPRAVAMFERNGRRLSDYFDGTFLSYELKCLKPDPEIFRKVAQAGVVPAETLFVDDSQRNLDVAVPFGFDTLLVDQQTPFAATLYAKLRVR